MTEAPQRRITALDRSGDGRLTQLHPESRTLTVVVGALLCVQAICNVAAPPAASYDPDRALLTASVASGICAVLLVTVVAWVWAVFKPDSMLSFRFSALTVGQPLVTLLALLATLAWTQRSTPPELPRDLAILMDRSPPVLAAAHRTHARRVQRQRGVRARSASTPTAASPRRGRTSGRTSGDREGRR